MNQTEREEAIAIRNDLEETCAAMQTVINKLNQLIEGEITDREYIQWCDDNEEMLDQGEF